MIIIITGTPGAGKSTIAKALATKLKFEYVDVSEIVREKKLADSYDTNRDCNVVDTVKLNKVLIKLIKEEQDLVIDSHMSHYLDSKYVNLCVVVKCNPEIMEKRLKERGYHSAKVAENVDCEILDVCLNEAKENKHNVLVVDGSEKDVKKLVDAVSKMIKKLEK